jgi:hypothetical protein
MRHRKLGNVRGKRLVDVKSTGAIRSRRGRDTEMGILIYCCHGRNFSLPVPSVILDDAQGINPEVTDAKFPSDADCVDEQFGHGFERKSD